MTLPAHSAQANRCTPRRPRRLAAALLTLLALGAQACVPVAPRLVGYGEARPTLFGRDIEVETRAAYYDSPPTCALIDLPPGAFADPAHDRQVAAALAAHFGARLGSVITVQQVRQAARDLALDPARADHRARLARHLRCPTVLRAEPYGGRDVYAGVWTQARVGLAVELRRAADDTLLWRARHVATRSAGGLPLSPLGAAGEAVAAATFQADPELPASLLHDATRRLAAGLPSFPGRPATTRAQSRPRASSAKLSPSRSP